MHWPTVELLTRETPLPNGYTSQFIRREDVATVIALVRLWYPEIAVGLESCHLDPDFYLQHVNLVGTAPGRPVFASVLRDTTDAIVALFTAEFNANSRNLSGRLAVIAPDHRSMHLGTYCVALLERLGRLCGAASVFSSATLQHPQTQIILERCGFCLVGIVPAYDRDNVAPNSPKHVYEALYTKVLVAACDLAIPQANALTPVVRQLWSTLFPNEPLAAEDGGAKAARSVLRLASPTPRVRQTSRDANSAS